MNKAGLFKVIVLVVLMPIVFLGVFASASYAESKERIPAEVISVNTVATANTDVVASQSPIQRFSFMKKTLMRNASDECNYCVENRTNSVQFIDWTETDTPPSGTLGRFLLDPFQTHCATKNCGAPLYLVIYNVSGSILRTVPVEDNSTYTIRYTP